MAEKNTAAAEQKPKHLNDGVDLSGFDYSKMVGKPYFAYLDTVEGKITNPEARRRDRKRGGGLDAHKKYIFDIYKVLPKYRLLYPDSDTDNSAVLEGFTLVQSAPIRSTTTFLHMALNLNAQLDSKQMAGKSSTPAFYEYYLLQKPTN